MSDETAATIRTLVAELVDPDIDRGQAGVRLRQLAEVAEGRAAALAASLRAVGTELGGCDPAIAGTILTVLHASAVRAAGGGVPAVEPEILADVADHLPASATNTHLLGHLLASRRDADSLSALVEFLRDHPPGEWTAAGQVLSPLMQSDDWPVEAFFPAALDLIGDGDLAAPVLDVASYTFRAMDHRPHVAAGRVAVLNRLLGEVVARLARFESDPRSFGDDVATVQRRLGAAVALAVSLCDNLGAIGEETSVPKLEAALELKHRRVQCEAAGALASMGVDEGKQRLLALAADPAARLRSLAYAEELGFGDEVDPTYRSADSTAIAEMAVWLSAPMQMGVPPTALEVVESRTLAWPGFEEPIGVTLVGFEYDAGGRRYSNVGVTGPITHVMSCDVADLPVDDIFAVYAGWQVEHDEIFEVPREVWNDAQQRIAGELAKVLDREGYEDLRPERLGFFLDEVAAVFTADKDGTEVRAVTDGLETIDVAVGGRGRPLGAEDVLCLYRGRKILRTFNPG